MTWEFLDAILVCGRTRHTDPDLVPDILNYYTSLYVPEKSVKKETWLSKLWKKLNFFFKFEFLKEINRIHNNNKQRMIKYGNK